MLGHVVSRGRLTGENVHSRHPLRLRIGFDPVIAGNDVQHIHQLAFVLMDAFDLHIKQRLRIHHHIKLLRNIAGQPLFVFQFSLTHRLIDRRIVDMLLQLVKLAQIGPPGAADMLIQHFRQRRVGQRQPAARRDAVGDVGKAHREDFSEFGKQRLHHQPRMQLRHAVDLVADHHRQPGHPHATAVGLVDNRGSAEQRGIIGILLLQGLEEVIVNLEDNLQMARQNFAQHIHRPGLKRLAHQRMVGIGEDLTGHLERLVPAEFMFVDKQAHQLRY